jgi:hypothetical protein
MKWTSFRNTPVQKDAAKSFENHDLNTDGLLKKIFTETFSPKRINETNMWRNPCQIEGTYSNGGRQRKNNWMCAG